MMVSIRCRAGDLSALTLCNDLISVDENGTIPTMVPNIRRAIATPCSLSAKILFFLLYFNTLRVFQP